MQQFERHAEPPPTQFGHGEFSEHRSALFNYMTMHGLRRSQTRAPDFDLPLDSPVINETLRRLFHDKCAFCESHGMTRPYRFRPVGDVLPSPRKTDPHLYYCWLSNAWENIYPICNDCWPEHPEYFPVKGRRASVPSEPQLRKYVSENLGLWRVHPPREHNLLLDPCAQKKLYRHFAVNLQGYLYSETEEGRATIKHFKLDREGLVVRRRERLEEYFEILIDRVLPDPEFRRTGYSDIFDFAELEFGGLWYLMCRQIVSIFSVGSSKKLSLSPAGIVKSFRKIIDALKEYSREDLAEQLDAIEFQAIDDAYWMRGFVEVPSAIRSIRIVNFKSIENLELTLPNIGGEKGGSQCPEPALLILGENAAGKSSILEAIALTLASEEARASLGVDVASLPLVPSLLGVASEAQCESALIELKFHDDLDRELTIRGGGFQTFGGADLPPVFAYGAYRQYQSKQVRYSYGKSIINLFRSDTVLSNPERWLLGLNDVDFANVGRALRSVLSIEGDYEFLHRDFDNGICSIAAEVGGNLHYTPLSLASSGYRSMLAMVCDIIQGLMGKHQNTFFEDLHSARAVVLIDEVEAHLHPRWKLQIMSALRHALPKVTFIATTHDPLCLRGMQDDEVVVLRRVINRGSNNCKWPVVVENTSNLPGVGKLTIEQLLTSDYFNLASTDDLRAERDLTLISELFLRRSQGKKLSSDEEQALAKLESDIGAALPIGSSEVQRLVQEAVIEYLVARRRTASEKLAQLRVEAKHRIIRILESL